MGAAQVSNWVKDDLAERLLGEGFIEQNERKWIRTTKPEISEIIEIAVAGRAAYIFTFGIGINFSPKFSRSGLKWKRTFKSLDFDLLTNPIDFREDFGRFVIPRNLAADGSHMAPRTKISDAIDYGCAVAFSYFSSINSICDLPKRFQELEDLPTKRFGTKNYIQFDLGYGIALIASNCEQHGRLRINRFCERYKVAADDVKLNLAIARAKALAGTLS